MKRKHRFAVPVALFLVLPLFGFVQVSFSVQSAQGLPPAPAPQTVPTQSTPYPQANAQSSSPPQTPGTPMSLTLTQAEALAIKNNPQISVGRLIALASLQVTR